MNTTTKTRKTKYVVHGYVKRMHIFIGFAANTRDITFRMRREGLSCRLPAARQART